MLYTIFCGAHYGEVHGDGIPVFHVGKGTSTE
jgi:hypothetical protein